MQHAERLPNLRALVVPVVALVIGAAAATGTYALLDSEQVQIEPQKVVVSETPAQPGQGVAVKDEAATAAAIGAGVSTNSFGKDEAASAAAIGSAVSSLGSDGVNAKDEAATAAAIGDDGILLRGSKASQTGSTSSAGEETAARTDPHGSALIIHKLGK